MRETTGSPSAALTPASDGPRVNRNLPEGGAADPAELRVAQDRERIALGLNDLVIRRLFAAGLDLHAALALMGDHRATGQIGHAIDELDQATRDIRDIIFNHLAAERSAPPFASGP